MKSGQVSLDALDYKILNLLLKDAKVPYAEIGKQFNVSSGTIFVRVKKMQEQNIITGSSIQVNYNLLNYHIFSYLGIQLEANQDTFEIARQIKEIVNITDIQIVSGKFDIMCHIMCKELTDLSTIIHQQIKKIQGIRFVESIVALENIESNKQILKDGTFE